LFAVPGEEKIDFLPQLRFVFLQQQMKGAGNLQ
jgi:hypothetical protein